MNRFIIFFSLIAAVAVSVGCAGASPVSRALVTDMDSVTEAAFRSVVFESDLPTVVLFTGRDCAPCRSLDKMIDKVAPEYDGWVRFVKLNTGSSEAVCRSAKVEALPTLVVYDGRKVLDRKVGHVEKDALRTMLNAVLDIDD